MSERLIDGDLNGVEVRGTVRNWPEDVRAIVDGEEYDRYDTRIRFESKDDLFHDLDRIFSRIHENEQR